MREILFRAKRIDNGEWVFGSFCMDALEQFNGLCGVDGFIRLYDKYKGKMQMYEVDRETVGQFTGLTDKNGKKIFEGDIVRCTRTLSDEKEMVGHIVYDECCFSVKENKTLNQPAMDLCDGFEVIGNIHDNLELLEVE